MKKWQLLFVNGCECKSQICNATEVLNSCQDGTCINVLGNYVENNDTLVQ
jgi:hypothetical protein